MGRCGEGAYILWRGCCRRWQGEELYIKENFKWFEFVSLIQIFHFIGGTWASVDFDIDKAVPGGEGGSWGGVFL